MKLTEIKNKYKKAFSQYLLFREEIRKKYGLIRARDLYTFFDKRAILIEVSPDYDFANEKIIFNSWYFNINNGKLFKNQIFDNVRYKTRRLCEEAAFIKAFEVLENNMK